MKIKKLSIIPVREQIFNRVKEAIITNEYKAGQIIQIEKLARQFGVSATPIRETLIRLENSGLVRLIPNKGAQVTSFTEQDIRDTWEMRKLLEPYAGRISSALYIDSEIARIRQMITTIMEEDYDFNDYLQTDNDIHEMLFIHLSNTLLRETMDRVHHISMRMRYFPEGANNDYEVVIHEVNLEHLTILDAFEAKDPDQVERTIYQHIVNSEQRTLKSTSQE